MLVERIFDKPNVELERPDELSAALISKKWDSNTYKSVEDCDFKVVAKQSEHELPRGIFASIRRMNLRKSSSNDCIDFVVFEVGSHKSPKICGVIDGDAMYDRSNFFEAPGGTMKVTVYLNRYTILESGKELEIDFVFTAYDGKSFVNQF